MNWHELARNPLAITHLWDEVPPLHGMEVGAIELRRDGPLMRFHMDFPRFADHLPNRWDPYWNTVAIVLDFSGPEDLKLTGWSTNPILDFSVEQLVTGLSVQANGKTIQLSFRCDEIYIQKTTGYHNTERRAFKHACQ